MSCSRLVVVGIAGSLCFGCGDAIPQAEAPATHELLAAPDVLSLAAGAQAQLSAQANDAEGNPIPGARVAWQSVEDGRLQVDDRGLVTAIGPTGPAEIVASSGAARHVVRINVVPGAPASIRKLAGDQQEAGVTQPLPGVIAVAVSDALGNPIAGAAVRFAPDAGTAAPATASTNAEGVAEAHWTLGDGAGTQTLEASLDPPRSALEARFAAHALAGTFARLEAVGSLAASAVVAETIGPRVRATDGFGNPKEGVAVLWEVTEGGGELDAVVTETDATGTAEARWRLGEHVGANVIVARAEGLGDGAKRFEVVGRPSAPVRLVALADTQSAAPAVRVEDGFGNPVPAVLVRIRVAKGGGSVAPEAAMTDADGVARAKHWTPDAWPAALDVLLPGGGVSLRVEQAEPRR